VITIGRTVMEHIYGRGDVAGNKPPARYEAAETGQINWEILLLMVWWL